MNGPARWLRSYALMVEWEARGLRLFLPLAIAAQLFLGAGLAVGFGMLIGEMSRIDALYLACGVAVITMLTIGFALVPQMIAAQKMRGVYDYVWSLPVPRSCSVAASLTVNSLIALPGAILALAVAGWRYDLDFAVGASIVPAVALTLAMSASVGYAMAHAIPEPRLTNLAGNVLVFVILLFSPINFPAERLPGWLATIHRVLPFQHAANVVRAGLTEGLATGVEESFAVLGAWALGAWLLTAWVVGRRP